MRGPEAHLKKVSGVIQEGGDAFPGKEPSELVLALEAGGAAPFAEFPLLRQDLTAVVHEDIAGRGAF
jgi:hypothetical protein